MKNLPGLRPLVFCVLVLTVALGVFAGEKEKQTGKKHTKYLVKFGWDEDNNLDPVDHSVAEITAKLDNDVKRYKVRHYDDGNPGSDQGDLNDVCLPTSSPVAAAATPSGSIAPAASPSASAGGSKTQTVGIASFTNADKASAFATFVNSTPTPTPKPKAKKK